MAQAEEAFKNEEQAAIAVEVAPREEKAPARKSPKPRHLRPYHVVIWNDEEHSYEYVIDLLMTLFGHSFEKAFQITDTVHHAGKGIAHTTHRELAELKRDQILSAGADFRMSNSRGPIRATVEPAPE